MTARRVTILGCGTSGGVPRADGEWGVCDPAEPRNRRRRASILVQSERANIVVDTTPGATRPIVEAVRIARPGGTIVWAGLKHALVSDFPSDEVAMRYQTIKGVRTQGFSSFRQAVQLIESGRVPVERMHTHHFGLDEAAEAVETLAEAGRHEAISITIEP